MQNSGMAADALAHDEPGGDDAARLTDAQRALRIQMLATEHWSLLASRSTTQSEVLTRIAIFLTLVSVGLFALGVMGNATQFKGWFGVAALAVLLVLVVLGMITQERVFNASAEDLVYVLAMNRLRGAYVDVDPGIERYLITSPADDPPGVGRTYFPFPRTDASHFLASSMMVILVVETALVGLFVGSLTYALSASIGWSIGVGLVIALASTAFWMQRSFRSYGHALRTHTPLRRTPAAEPEARDSREPAEPAPAASAPAPTPATPAPATSAPATAAPALATSDGLHEGDDPPSRRSRRRTDG